MPFAAKNNSFPCELWLTWLVVLRMEGGSSLVDASCWAEEQWMRCSGQKWLVCQRWGEKPERALRLGLRKLPRSQTWQSRDKKDSCVEEEHRFLYIKCQHYSRFMGWTFIWYELLTDAAALEFSAGVYFYWMVVLCWALLMLYHVNLYNTLRLELLS